MTDEEVFAAAMNLDQKRRAELASQLLESLDVNAEEVSPDEWERAWGEEAARRLEELRQGKAEAVPGEEVLRELRNLLA